MKLHSISKKMGMSCIYEVSLNLRSKQAQMAYFSITLQMQNLQVYVSKSVLKEENSYKYINIIDE